MNSNRFNNGVVINRVVAFNGNIHKFDDFIGNGMNK